MVSSINLAVCLAVLVSPIFASSSAEQLKCISNHYANMKAINSEMQESFQKCLTTFSEDLTPSSTEARAKRAELDNDANLIIALLKSCIEMEGQFNGVRCTSEYVSFLRFFFGFIFYPL